MTVWQSLSGMLDVELTGADPAATLKRTGDRGIALYAVTLQNELSIRLQIQRRDFAALEELAQKRGDRLRVLHRRGLFWSLAGLLHRPVLVSGLAALLLVSFFLPTRVLFLQVDGNEGVESARILEAAAQCGLRFGVSRRSIRSEQVKNALLSDIPTLQWAGVNTSGCRAVISVRERSPIPEAEGTALGSIVAAQDGIILTAAAQEGNLLCQPGQAVAKGEVLISGYQDCGLCIKALRARGEIFAQTSRTVTAITPTSYFAVGPVKSSHRQYSILLGKKRIIFWNSSGIWESTCGRIYKEQYLTLPGGFRLPLGLAVEEVTEYDLSPESVETEALLRQFSDRYLLVHTAAGEIIHKQEQVLGEGQLITRYSCREMIGRFRPEQIGEYHGQAD